MAISATRVTRLGNYGGARQAYGSFAGKTATVAVGPPKGTLPLLNVGG